MDDYDHERDDFPVVLPPPKSEQRYRLVPMSNEPMASVSPPTLTDLFMEEVHRQAKRGNTYRRRALALRWQAHSWRTEAREKLTALKIHSCREVVEPLVERFNAERETLRQRALAAEAERDAARVMELLARDAVTKAAQHIANAEHGRKQALAECQRLEAMCDALLMIMTPEVSAVLALKREHAHTWRDESDTFWLARLAEEVIELTAALEGLHEHSPETELRQISAIALNWLELRRERAALAAEGKTK